MNLNTVLIKNMVCSRCVLAVEHILHSESIPFHNVIIGQARLAGELSENERATLVSRFQDIGFELIDNRNTALIERIKQLLVEKARNDCNDSRKKIKLSRYLSGQVNYEYTYISSLFSSVEGRTIENYFLAQRIEKVKELLTYDTLTLVQIAFNLDYSSVAHLSNQFKKITGLTPSHFKQVGVERRTSLDKV